MDGSVGCDLERALKMLCLRSDFTNFLLLTQDQAYAKEKAWPSWLFEWRLLFGKCITETEKQWTNSPDDGHKIDETRITASITWLRRVPPFWKHRLQKMKRRSRQLWSIDLAFSKCSCWAVDYFHEFPHKMSEIVLVAHQRGKKKKKRCDILSKMLSGKGPRLKKPCSCFTECSAPRSSLTSLSWIWMMLNPWEESCLVRHNCSIGKFLQTDPRTSLDNRVSSTGDSVCLHFHSHAHKQPLFSQPTVFFYFLNFVGDW